MGKKINPVVVRAYVPDAPPSGASFIKGRSGGYYLEVSLHDSKGREKYSANYQAANLFIKPEFSKPLQMRNSKFSQWYKERTSATLDLLAQYRQLEDVPEITNGSGNSSPISSSIRIRALEEALDLLAQYRQLEDVPEITNGSGNSGPISSSIRALEDVLVSLEVLKALRKL